MLCFALMVCALRLWEACRLSSSELFMVGDTDVLPAAVAQYIKIRNREETVEECDGGGTPSVSLSLCVCVSFSLSHFVCR